ncbi:MAG: hypothetical protein GQ532_16385 [Methylomarinum sp.]|nr:hypothetical protein [Methylomarinum sp.]
MNISTSNSLKQDTQTNAVSLESIFSLLDSDKNIISSSLTFEQAKPLSEHIQDSTIKFQAMVVNKHTNSNKPIKRQGNPLEIAVNLDVMARFYDNIGAKHFDKRQQNKVLTDQRTAEIALTELLQFDTDELILLGKKGSALAKEINSAKKRLFETKQRFIKIVGEMTGDAV